jgi:hypothetical protein
MMHMNDEAAILLFDDVVKLKAQQHPKATHADPNARIRLTYVSLIITHRYVLTKTSLNSGVPSLNHVLDLTLHSS